MGAERKICGKAAWGKVYKRCGRILCSSQKLSERCNIFRKKGTYIVKDMLCMAHTVYGYSAQERLLALNSTEDYIGHEYTFTWKIYY